MEIPLETVVLQWKSLKWEEFRGRIETELLEMLAEDQQAILQGRKQLVDATKDFKKIEDDKKINELPTLLKEYQTQIDGFTKRFAAVESAANDILKPFLVLDNPTSIFQMALNNQIAGEELEELKQELSRLKANNKESIEKLAALENENANLKRSNELLNVENVEFKTQTNALHSDIAGASSLIVKLQEQVGQANEVHEQLKAEKDDQILKLSHQIGLQEGMLESMAQEVDVLSATLDQSRQQALELQQEISRLKLAASSPSMTSNQETLNLQEELDAEKKQAFKREQQHGEAIKDLMEQLAKLNAELEQRSDYLEIKNKYAALLVSEFGEADESNQSLEMILQGKCKRLETEIVKLRQQYSEASNSKSTLEAELIKIKASLQSLEQSVEQYEQMAKSPSMSPDQSAVFDDNSSVHGGQIHSDDIITILTNQRERFKRRNAELEQNMQKMHQEGELNKTEMSRLKADYNKVMQRLRQVESQTFFKTKPSGKDVELGAESDFVKAIRGLGRFDEAVNKIGRVLFSNRMGKKLVTFYFFLIHIVLFIMFLQMNNAPADVSA